MSFNIAFVPFPDLEKLDFVGLYKALAATEEHIDEQPNPYTDIPRRSIPSLPASC